MKNLNYITYDAWWDTDITVLDSLKSRFNLTVHVINGAGEKKYNSKFCKDIKIIEYNQHFKTWNLQRIRESCSIFFSIYNKCKTDDYVFYILGSDILFKLLFLLFFSSRRVIISSHNYIEHCDVRGGFNDHIKKLYYKKFKKFHFFSKQQSLLFSKDYPSKSTFFSSMPPKDYGILPKRENCDKVSFLFFGFIREYKRLDLFIKAANIISRTYDNVEFYIAGACENWAYYDKMIKSQSIKLNIGFINNEDIPKIFSNTDYLVLPYDDSTQSGPALIALNYCKPIIASNLQVFEDIIHDGENGYIFTKGDLTSLIRVMSNCMKLSQSDYQYLVRNQLIYKERMLSNDSLGQKLCDFLNA